MSFDLRENEINFSFGCLPSNVGKHQHYHFFKYDIFVFQIFQFKKFSNLNSLLIGRYFLMKPQKSSLKTNQMNSVRMGKELCFRCGDFHITRPRNCRLLPSNGHQSMMTYLLFLWVLMTFPSNHMVFWYSILSKILLSQAEFQSNSHFFFLVLLYC